MSFTGRCACGAVTATIAAEAPVAVRQCWCHQCQKVAAGGSTNNAIFPAESVTVSGALGQHGYTAPSGNTLTQYFCPQCGTAVMAQSSGRLHLRTFRLGFLDPGHGLVPDTVIWTAEAPEWAQVDQRGNAYADQGPPPAAPVGQ
jgi:hypothetical protein